MMQEKAIAVLTMHDADTMPKDQRSKIATWLRQKADMLVKEGGPKGKMAKRFRARYLVGIISSFLLMVMVTGCVTKYDDIVSDFHTIQVGPICTTVGHDQRKFNAETKEPDALTCRCDQLISVKRLVVKAGDSPEAWSCPAPVHQQMYQTSMVPSVQIYRAKSLASTYVPAIGEAAGLGAIGGGIAAAQAARITQSVAGSSVRTSTLVLDGPVPPGVAR